MIQLFMGWPSYMLYNVHMSCTEAAKPQEQEQTKKRRYLVWKKEEKHTIIFFYCSLVLLTVT